jgi:YVTN family beta-propeller protein
MPDELPHVGHLGFIDQSTGNNKPDPMKTFAFSILAILLVFASCNKQEIDSTKKLYVANESHSSVTVIDATTYEVLRFIKLGGAEMRMPHNIQSRPDGKQIWLTYNDMNGESGYMIIDPLTDEIISDVHLGSWWDVAHIVFDSASANAYIIAADSNMVVEVNTTTLALTRKFRLGPSHSPHGLRYAGGKLFVANIESRSLAVIDLQSEIITEIPIGGSGIQAAVSPDGQFAFVSVYDTKKIFRYTIATGDTVSFPLPSQSQGPIQIYPANGNQLLICDQGMLSGRAASNILYKMDMTNGSIIAAIYARYGTHGVVTDPDGIHAYCTNRVDHSMSVIDIINDEVLCNVPTGVDPNGVTYWSTTGGQP